MTLKKHDNVLLREREGEGEGGRERERERENGCVCEQVRAEQMKSASYKIYSTNSRASLYVAVARKMNVTHTFALISENELAAYFALSALKLNIFNDKFKV